MTFSNKFSGWLGSISMLKEPYIYSISGPTEYMSAYPGYPYII